MNKKKKKIIAGIIVVLVLGWMIYNTQNLFKVTNEFKAYLSENEKSFSEHMIGSEEKTYKKLIKESKQAISYKNVNEIPIIKEKLIKLDEKAINENSRILNKKLDDIRSVNFNKLNNSDIEKINNEIKETENLIKEKRFKDASHIIDSLNNEIYSAVSK